MPRAAKRSFYADLADFMWRALAYAYGKAPDKVCFSAIWPETDSSAPNPSFDRLASDGFITGSQEEFTITEKGKAFYEREYVYYHYLYPTVSLVKPSIVKQIVATRHYWAYRIQTRSPFAAAIRKAWSNRRQRRHRTIKYTQAQAAIEQITALPSNFDDCLHQIAMLIQEYLGINVVAIFIADPAAEWSTFRTGVAKEPHGEEGIRILRERGHKTYLRDKIWLIDYREGSSYQSDSAAACSHHLLSIPRLYLETRHFFGSPLFGYTGSAIYIPLFASQRQIGTLELDTFNTQASFRQDELRTLLPLANQVAQICERYLNTDQPVEQRTTSPGA